MNPRNHIPLHDSLCHPTVSGSWLSRGTENSFDNLVEAMAANGVERANAVALAGQDGYDHESFIAACRKHPQLVPIAGLDPLVSDIETELETIKSLEFKGVKIHPSLSNCPLETHLDPVAKAAKLAGKLDLPVLLCCYFYGRKETLPVEPPVVSVTKLLNAAPDTRFILMHGGGIDLMRFAEIIRRRENCLLDLSFTMTKFQGSSLGLDIRYLFNHFDRRICVGSDHPDVTINQFRQRFDQLAENVPKDKLENIGHKNLDAMFSHESTRIFTN